MAILVGLVIIKKVNKKILTSLTKVSNILSNKSNINMFNKIKTPKHNNRNK